MRALSFATVFAALSGFIVLWIAQWPLDTETELRYFQAYWGLFFASTGLVDGITQETTRAVAGSRESNQRRNANPWKLGGAVAAIVAGVALALGFLLMAQVVPTSPQFASLLLAFGLMSYVFQAVLSGILSGAQLWNQYAGLVALDSGIRLALVIVAWYLGWGLEAFLLITVIGALSWIAILGLSPTARTSIRTALDVNQGAFARRVVSAMLASGSTAALITGYPTFLNAAFPHEDPTTLVTIAGIANAVTLTRAPILVPLQRFQSALVVRFVESKDHIYIAVARPVAAVLGIGALGFVAAWLLGPWILRIAFKEELFVPGLILGLLTFASALAGSLMVTGTAVLALEQHTWYVAGWILASVVAYSTLFLSSLGLVPAVCTSLIVGPLAGAVVHLVALGRARVAPHTTYAQG
ncbi:hypothetical protein QP027_00825 [Corynebacterium breve]|uniref:Polysaccharide biosynthesis protein n=1 Tax=Corynebacterium breve TaxID=3049799 RepID=A0ABY8VF55_9CORY|nr:hypothetical protein [Corynebacterium breve]WIM67977.1 hypothetical protein QP027_00825 [Corynebacterium breve]